MASPGRHRRRASPSASLAGERLGLATRAERGYAMAVIAATGGWLAAATAAGPAHGPLPRVLVIATLCSPCPGGRTAGAAPRSASNASWPPGPRSPPRSAWPDHGSCPPWSTCGAGGPASRLARGQTITDVIAKLPAIESGAGHLPRRRPRLPDPGRPGQPVRVAGAGQGPARRRDHLARPVGRVHHRTHRPRPVRGRHARHVLLLRRHALFGGATGSGKSGGLNVLMGNLTACTDVVIWAIDLKRGMELGPWAACLGRLATTPAEARALLADAVAILEARAAYLAATGQRVWQPSPDMPALIIVIDEYAELVESAPEATGDADSIARRGRAVAVTLIAATQRPTQKAMGQGALRSQMDVRICFRVRERKDVDLVLGQGMLSAGWHAHKLNAPGKFLISAPEHDTPRRARAYLLTDQAVTDTATWHATLRPNWTRYPSGRWTNAPRRARRPAAVRSRRQTTRIRDGTPGDTSHDPEAMLWAACPWPHRRASPSPS